MSRIHEQQQQQALNPPIDGIQIISLKDWFLMSGRSWDRSRSSNGKPPRILLLDGGVSTHLEEKLRQCRCCTTSSDCIEKNNDNNGSSTTNDDDQTYVFPHRELWSSSLLLNEDGRQQIYQGHLDWLQKAKVDVISTVTYQCHYIPQLWPQQQQHHLPIVDHEQMNEGSKEQNVNPIITNTIMDQMWRDGIRLAQQAVVATTTMDATLTSHGSTTTDAKLKPQYHRRPHYVIASSGCYGAALSNGAEYTGLYTIPSKCKVGQVKNDDELISTTVTTSLTYDEPHMLNQMIYDFHLQKLQTILRNDPPVSGIAIETVPSYLECQILRDLFVSDDASAVGLRDSMKNVACYVSLSCRNGSQLNDGTLLIDALKVFHDIPTTTLQAIGLNCCSIRYIPDLLRTLLTDIIQHSPNRGIVVFPNSGELWDGTTKQWYPDPELVLSMAATTTSGSSTTDALTLMKHVIHQIDTIWEELCSFDTNTNSNLRTRRKPSILIGGCCRMTVETIAALRTIVDEYLLNHPNSV